MPKCFGCKNSVPSDDLMAIGDELFCSECRVLHVEPARAEGPKKEVTMSKERKPIASIEIFRNEMEDNYDIVGYVRISGVKLEIDTSMNRIRDFFTRRRQPTDLSISRAEASREKRN